MRTIVHVMCMSCIMYHVSCVMCHVYTWHAQVSCIMWHCNTLTCTGSYDVYNRHAKRSIMWKESKRSIIAFRKMQWWFIIAFKKMHRRIHILCNVTHSNTHSNAFECGMCNVTHTRMRHGCIISFMCGTCRMCNVTHSNTHSCVGHAMHSNRSIFYRALLRNIVSFYRALNTHSCVGRVMNWIQKDQSSDSKRWIVFLRMSVLQRTATHCNTL